MRYFVLRKLFLLLTTLVILSVLSYGLAFLFPGDPLHNLSGLTPDNPGDAASLSQKYAMEHNPVIGYFRYMSLLMNGEWGYSFTSGGSLLSEIAKALPASLELTLLALMLSLLVGIPVGLLAGLRQHKFTDYSIIAASLVGYSVPVFWLALLLILVFSLQLGWLPMSGRISLLYDVPVRSGFILLDIWYSDIPDKMQALRNALQHMVLPTLSIAVVSTTIIIRLTRRSIVDIMEQDYIQAARGRGASPLAVFWAHGMRNALVPILPILILQFNTLLTSAMIVESIFSWPGIGHWLLQAIAQRDYPAIRAGMLAVSSLVIIFSIGIEILLRSLDPVKGRYQYAPF